MSKKIPLILIVAILGLLSAATMWYISGRSSGMMGTTTMNVRRGEMMGGVGIAEPVMLDKAIDSRGMGMTSMPYPYPGGNDALEVADRSIQQSSYHSVVVDDVDGYLRMMREYIQSAGGTVLSYSQGTSDNNYVYGNLYVKVPVYKFDEAVNKVTEGVKKVVNANVDMQDVTGQVVSLEKQLQSLQDQRAEQIILLEEATTTADRSRIQLQIDRIDRQVEQLEQSQQAVEDRIEYASLNISAANKEYYYTGGGPRPLGDVFREAWYSLRGTGFGILYFLIWVVVYAIIWLPVLLLARWLWGKVRPTVPQTTSKSK